MRTSAGRRVEPSGVPLRPSLRETAGEVTFRPDKTCLIDNASWLALVSAQSRNSSGIDFWREFSRHACLYGVTTEQSGFLSALQAELA